MKDVIILWLLEHITKEAESNIYRLLNLHFFP
jgi:hypothetical protein